MKNKPSSPAIIISIVLIVLLAWALFFVFGVLKGTKSATSDEVEFMALVTGVVDADSDPLLVFTLVEWLSGEDARSAIAKDTDCNEENVEVCSESFANHGFYIRPVVDDLQLTVHEDITITFMENGQKTEKTLDDLRARLEAPSEILFVATYKKDTVTHLNEEYLP